MTYKHTRTPEEKAPAWNFNHEQILRHLEAQSETARGMAQRAREMTRKAAAMRERIAKIKF